MNSSRVIPVIVPAHTGGADLSNDVVDPPADRHGPRPHGRGGFKYVAGVETRARGSPRPHGRGGFKLDHADLPLEGLWSPPTRAGRI